jgi:hypothetical protein
MCTNYRVMNPMIKFIPSPFSTSELQITALEGVVARLMPYPGPQQPYTRLLITQDTPIVLWSKDALLSGSRSYFATHVLSLCKLRTTC